MEIHNVCSVIVKTVCSILMYVRVDNFSMIKKIYVSSKKLLISKILPTDEARERITEVHRLF